MITFFGVSGCGKTHAVVEMLAQNWGSYLNGSRADRGSKDVTTLFESAQKMPTRYFSSDKVQNGLNVQTITGRLLISRLMVLKYCLSLGRHDTFTCDRWMLLQVCSGAFDEPVSDVFDDVFRIILNAYVSAAAVEGIRTETLQEGVRNRHDRIRIFKFGRGRAQAGWFRVVGRVRQVRQKIGRLTVKKCVRFR